MSPVPIFKIMYQVAYQLLDNPILTNQFNKLIIKPD